MARILVIDDSREIREFLRYVLQAAGHEVIETANGAQGLGAYEESPADVIFCDLNMPEKDGLATIEELRARWLNVRVIAISGGDPCAPRDKLRLAPEVGAMMTLRKPFRAEQVRVAVKAVLMTPLAISE
jgi:DNA-binding response OmpR family regulator